MVLSRNKMSLSKENGVLTHENTLGIEAGKQSKSEQLIDNEICRLLVDEESKKSLNKNRRLSISSIDQIRISADLQGTERSAIIFDIFVSKVVSSTRQHVPPNSYAIFHYQWIYII